MPTPSSNHSRDPSAPPPYSFSSCPDDLQYSSSSIQQAHEEMRSDANATMERRSPTPDDAPAPDSDSQPSQAGREDSLFVEEHVSAEQSSRATTVSPQPHPTASGRGFPGMQGDHDLDILKSRPLEKGRDARANSAVKSRPLDDSPLDQHDSEIETFDDIEDGDIHTSSYMGLDYTNRRVSKCHWQTDAADADATS